MLTEEQIRRMTPEEMLAVVMRASAEVTIAASNCLRFGWDLQFGSGSYNEHLIEKKKELDQITKAFLLATRRGI